MLKRLSLATLLASASLAAQASPEASTLQFSGAVKNSTCTFTTRDGEVDGKPITVALNPIPANKIDYSSAYAGSLTFFLRCPGSGITKARIVLAPANGTTVTNGKLDNMATVNPAKNVLLWVYRNWGEAGEANGANFIDFGVDQSTSTPFYRDSRGSFTLSHHFYYHKTPNAGLVEPGNFEAAVQYTLEYL